MQNIDGYRVKDSTAAKMAEAKRREPSENKARRGAENKARVVTSARAKGDAGGDDGPAGER